MDKFNMPVGPDVVGEPEGGSEMFCGRVPQHHTLAMVTRQMPDHGQSYGQH